MPHQHLKPSPGALRPIIAIVFLLAVVVLTLCACQKSETATGPSPGASNATKPWFEDITDRSGLRFKHEVGPGGKFFMPETVGSGCAVFDYDNDGRMDIYLVQNAGPGSKVTNKLFHQEPDGRFRDVSAGSGLDVDGYGMGVAIGDVNNDGRPDVLVTEYQRVRLFLNGGNGIFTDISKEAGIEDSHWAVSAAFVDYDRDGWLDLVIVNYIDYLETEKCFDRSGKPEYCGPNSRPGTVTQLYHNRGAVSGSNSSASPEGPRFEDVTFASGLAQLPGPGLGVLCADFDGDGWQDILVANDAKPNTLWINRHNGTFKNEAAARGIAYNEMGTAQANMGIAFGDVTGSGLFAVYITHLSEENNVFWLQDKVGLFQDRTAQAGLANTEWHGTGFGTAFADFDQDGQLDLAVVNGRVRRPNDRGGMSSGGALVPVRKDLGEHWSAYGERNQLFSNIGNGRFREVSKENPPFCGKPNVGRGLACADLNGDGAIDLLVTAVDGPARLYRNVAANRGHWLMIRVVDPKLGGRDAYGAQVSIVSSGRKQVAWINPGYSYASSSDPRAHFGLGASTRVDAIHVAWPDGLQEDFNGTDADKLILIQRGKGVGPQNSTPSGR